LAKKRGATTQGCIKSSRQEGECGEEGKQDLKMVNMRGASVNILPPFRADPHALGITLFEGGEDDMGTKEEVKPNFRTPPG
jgi:hypothetical protein